MAHLSRQQSLLFLPFPCHFLFLFARTHFRVRIKAAHTNRIHSTTFTMSSTGTWSDLLSFHLNGELVELSSKDVNPKMTLLEYLREHTLLTGTKASCTQGGCGACNVMLTTHKHGKEQFSSINACLCPLLSLHGTAITTTEGIGSRRKGFHAVQERIAACNGSQCGYCTPGQVMAMYSLLRDKSARPESGALTLTEIEERFDGNLCRCTGYRPILTAFHTFAGEEGRAHHDIEGLPQFEFGEYDPATEPAPPAPPANAGTPLRFEGKDGSMWYRPVNMAQLKEVVGRFPDAKLVVGHTSTGVYGADSTTRVFVHLGALAEVVSDVTVGDSALTVPAGTTITELKRALEANGAKSPSFAHMVSHIECVANWNVRNVGTVAGNIMMARTQGFQSDLATILMGANATVYYTTLQTGDSVEEDFGTFLTGTATGILVTGFKIPFLAPNEQYRSYRQALRSNNAHALVNAAFRASVNEEGVVSEAALVFGCIGRSAIRATAAEKALVGKKVSSQDTLNAVIAALAEVDVHSDAQYISVRQPEGKDAYRRTLMSTFVYKFLVALQGDSANSTVALTAQPSVAVPSSGKQVYGTVLPEDHPGRAPMPKLESADNASGESRFCDDFRPAGALYAAFALSTEAPALITGLDTSEVMNMPGVVDFVTASDIPGMNTSSPFAPGEELLLPTVYTEPKEGTSEEGIKVARHASTVLFVGQPVGIVVARSRREAEAAAKLVKVTYNGDGINAKYTIADALRLNETDGDPVVNAKGDVEAAFNSSDMTVVEGHLDIGGQCHFAMEKHTTTAVPDEQGVMKLFAATQAPDMVRGMVSAVLAKSGERVHVVHRRSGGGFGSKFSKNIWVAAGAAVCANKLHVPVKMQNNIQVDMLMGGNCRNPFRVDYKAAVDQSGKLRAIDVVTVQDKGCAEDFSMFVGMEIVNNCDNLYKVDNYRVSLTLVKTHTPSNTAVRAPGLAQSVGICETMMDHLAMATNVDPTDFREKNLLSENDETKHIPAPWPMAPMNYTVPRIWAELKASSNFDARLKEIKEFNSNNTWNKKGICMIPMRYTHLPVINAGITVHISVHADPGGATVDVHHGGSEIGQGIHTKVARSVAVTLGVPVEKVFVHGNQSSVVPQGLVGGSVASETTCAAAIKACRALKARLEPVKELIKKEREDAAKAKAAAGDEASGSDEVVAVDGEPTFNELAAKAAGGLMEGLKVNLTASANWAPKEMHVPGGEGISEFEDSPVPMGSYMTFGAAVSEVSVDVLTGQVTPTRTDILYDCGNSLNPLIDIGQAEGAFIMGQGFYLHEDVIYTKDGKLMTPDTWEYKPPLATNIPRDLRVEFLKDSPFELGMLGSKAIGEPPLLMAYSQFGAVRMAVGASRVERGKQAFVGIDFPATPDRVRDGAEVSPEDLSNAF
eukprot:m.1226721 g.1226721  ORF g.1226721 m.1226721 type:complete len:1408 (-) comp24639_c0_seq1:828-5051(-)